MVCQYLRLELIFSAHSRFLLIRQARYDFVDCWGIFKEMKRSGIAPNTSIYDQLISLCVRFQGTFSMVGVLV